jgi:hypothetical protein
MKGLESHQIMAVVQQTSIKVCYHLINLLIQEYKLIKFIGWPKFVAHLWLKNEQRNQLIAPIFGPCTVSTTLQNVAVTLQETTNYPFEDTVTVHFSVDRPAQFALCVRVLIFLREIISSHLIVTE